MDLATIHHTMGDTIQKQGGDSGVVRVHGTDNEPQLIPGCVVGLTRLQEENGCC